MFSDHDSRQNESVDLSKTESQFSDRYMFISDLTKYRKREQVITENYAPLSELNGLQGGTIPGGQKLVHFCTP